MSGMTELYTGHAQLQKVMYKTTLLIKESNVQDDTID